MAPPVAHPPGTYRIPEYEAAGSLRQTATSHLGLRVPDVATAAGFYTKVVGLSVAEELPNGGLRLGWGSGHHVLDLVEGSPGLDHIAFEIADPGGLDALERRLRGSGRDHRELDPSFLDDMADQSARGLVCTDPDGNQVQFHTACRRSGESIADPGRRPIRYQHVTLSTADVPAMVEFYAGSAGFRVSDQLADARFAWLRSDRDHHTLAVVDTGRSGGLDHYSFDVAEWADFRSWCDRLTDLGTKVAWGPGRHGPGNNLFVFFDDPAGNHIELSAEMERFYDDRVAYTPRRWSPVPESVNLWGGQLPSWRRTSGESDQ